MADLMILIAGCAVGIFWTQVYYKSIVAQDALMVLDWKFRIPMLSIYPSPILVTISVALLVCRLRKPRPNLRRLFRQPGAVAMACVFLLLMYAGAMVLAGRALDRIIDRIWPPAPVTGSSSIYLGDPSTLVYAVSEAGMFIATCWVLLLAVGRWRPEPTWIDRSGRCLGACWIVLTIVAALANSLPI
jgi:hypothetical protein